MENILLEYDKSPGIISPDFEKMDLHLPKRAVFAFLGEKRIERFVLARGGEKAGTFVSLTKDFPLWMIKADKEKTLHPSGTGGSFGGSPASGTALCVWCGKGGSSGMLRRAGKAGGECFLCRTQGAS